MGGGRRRGKSITCAPHAPPFEEMWSAYVQLQSTIFHVYYARFFNGVAKNTERKVKQHTSLVSAKDLKY